MRPIADIYGAVDAYLAFIARVEGVSPETVRAYGSHLEAYARWVERTGVDGLHPGVRDLRRYLAELHAAAYAPKTVAAHLSAVRSLYRWLVAEEVIDSDPASAISAPKLPKTLPHALSAEQLDALMAAPDTTAPGGLRDAAMLELLYASGARISELAGLDVGGVDAGERTVRLFGKGSKERIVPLYRRAVEATEAYLERGRPALLAAAGRTEPSGRPRALFVSARGRAMDAGSLRYRFEALVRAAGLPADITPHAMRHTFATDLLGGGADLRSVQELLGHASLSTTQLYTHLTPDRLRSALKCAHPRA